MTPDETKPPIPATNQEAVEPAPKSSIPGPFYIWCDGPFPPEALAAIQQGIGAHRLIVAGRDGGDSLISEADVALGQPGARQVIELSRLRWVHLTTAGYTRYDNDAVRGALRSRGAALTNSSSVYDEPCAQHLLAMMMSLARQLPACQAEQQGRRDWQSAAHRARAKLLTGQTAILFGYGAIGRRLGELLQPLRMNLIAVRRSPRGDESIQTVRTEQADEWLPLADHVIDILPAAPGTRHYFDATRISAIKPGAIFYNIGRGATVDQAALLSALGTGHLSAAFLDVTDPEPLPADHPLWSAPNCHITPHIAGGHADEFDRLAAHFLSNFNRFVEGKPLLDRIV